MDHLFNSIVAGLLTPVVNIASDASSRLYWPFIVIGLLIAFAVYTRRHGALSFYQLLFDRNVWFSKSARNDFAVLLINPVVLLLVSSWVFVNGEALTSMVSGFIARLGLAGEAGPAGQLVIGAALTLILFIVDDFMRWFGHYLHHRIPVLWEFHKVHHSAETLNFVTAERFHPAELVIMALLGAVSAALVNGVFIGLWGHQMSIATLAGANILWVAANVIGGVLRHSPFWISFGPRIERWLISPAMHQIHHSDDPKHFDRNLGGTLAVWDRWFGTIYIPDGEEKISYGIGPETTRFRPLSAIYLRPVVNAARLVARPFTTPRSAGANPPEGDSAR